MSFFVKRGFGRFHHKFRDLCSLLDSETFANCVVVCSLNPNWKVAKILPTFKLPLLEFPLKICSGG